MVLGITYFRLGSRGTSYNHIQEAYELFNTFPPAEVESHRLVGLCGIDLVDNARILDKDDSVSLTLDVEKKCTTLSDDLVHGRSLMGLGDAMIEAQRWQEALYYLDDARTVFKAVGNAFYLSCVYQCTAWVHYHEHRLSDALDAIEEAWKYTK